MNYQHASKHSKARHSLCAAAALLTACTVYDGGLVGAEPPLEGEAGAAGAQNRSGAGGDSGAAASATSGAASGGAGSPGGAGSSAADAGQAGSDATPEAGAGGMPPVELELEAIDDMEDGNAFVLSADERSGHWDVSNDATADASQVPPAAHFVMAELLDPARPDSHFAAYTKGNGFKGWGAVLTVSMITWPSYPETPTYDASAYAGISFYAKAGVGSDLGLRVRFIGAQTDDRGQQCTPGGDVTTACYDHFFADVKLGQSWQRFDLAFADFRQAGVGQKFPAIDVETVYALEFFFPGRATASGNAFELWVDDLAFVLK